MSNRPSFDRARRVIAEGLHARAYPAAVVDAGRRDGSIWSEAFGTLDYTQHAPRTSPATLFDLASLTKVIATTSIAMRAVETGLLAVDEPVSAILPEWRGTDRHDVTLRHCLDHSSGLPAHARLWLTTTGRDAYRAAIAALPLDRAAGLRSVYSDPGFLTLGFALETRGGAPLDALFAPIAAAIGEPIMFLPPAALGDRIAPTEHDPWRGRVLRGEVHDENAAALGGVAAHAGLFGTAGAVGAFARLVLRTFDETTALGSRETMRRFATRTGVPDSSRALGWDTMLPTSSCGRLLSPGAIGHTGFTGTSLWIDPGRDLYVVFLTNRVHPTRANEQLVRLRAPLHEAIVEDLDDAR